MKFLCLTGWQQPPDALAPFVPPDAIHAPYADFDTTDAFFASLPREADIGIGWSLGGQTLMRAVAGGHVRVKKLILLAPAYQFMASEQHPHGATAELWQGIRESYRAKPDSMIKEFSGHIAAGDVHAAHIIRTLNKTLSVWKNGLFWLDELARFSCSALDFSGFPPTLILHGSNDRVINAEQGRTFASAIPGAELHLIDQCGHAPQLHDEGLLKGILQRV